MNSLGIFFVLLTGLLARESKVSYAWNSSDPYVDNGVHLLLKQGLKIGYLPPSQYNCKSKNHNDTPDDTRTHIAVRSIMISAKRENLKQFKKFQCPIGWRILMKRYFLLNLVYPLSHGMVKITRTIALKTA